MAKAIRSARVEVFAPAARNGFPGGFVTGLLARICGAGLGVGGAGPLFAP